MTNTPPIYRGRKFDQVLEGARRVFLRDGFEGASVDDVARESGVSKATLYSYFPDKRLMFMEVFRTELAREADRGVMALPADASFEDLLPAIIHFVTDHLASEFYRRTYRIAVAEADRFPALSREYYMGGLRRGINEVVVVLRHAVSRGELDIQEDEMDLAAESLLHLCALRIEPRSLLLGQASVDETVLSEVRSFVMQMFMARFAPAKAVKKRDAG